MRLTLTANRVREIPMYSLYLILRQVQVNLLPVVLELAVVIIFLIYLFLVFISLLICLKGS